MGVIPAVFTFYDGPVCTEGACGMPSLVHQEQILIAVKNGRTVDCERGLRLNDVTRCENVAEAATALHLMIIQCFKCCCKFNGNHKNERGAGQ